MLRNKYILCLGHAILDSRCYLNELPKADGMVYLLKPIQNSCGGSAANVAYNLAKMGLKSRVCAAVGDGSVAKLVISQLQKFGVDTSGIRKMKGNTGRAVVLIDKDGHVKVLESIENADKYFKPTIKDFRNVCHLHMTGTNFKLLQSFSKMAHDLGITVSFDPGRSKVKAGIKKLSPILKRLSMLFLNRNELGLLVGASIDSVEDVKKHCEQLYKEFKFMIIVKGGSKEAVVYDGKKFYVKTPIKVKVVDTIGAGDAFDSAFIACYLDTGSVPKALAFAIKIASLKIQRLGAQALPPKNVVKKLFLRYCK
ncbi:MAG: carbohydrate kinase family protein [Candidatus Micrarchaeota archaeon]|nr:carbohydrate kinase family protein [Candidatus Micrarchaeota archaeon]